MLGEHGGELLDRPDVGGTEVGGIRRLAVEPRFHGGVQRHAPRGRPLGDLLGVGVRVLPAGERLGRRQPALEDRRDAGGEATVVGEDAAHVVLVYVRVLHGDVHRRHVMGRPCSFRLTKGGRGPGSRLHDGNFRFRGAWPGRSYRPGSAGASASMRARLASWFAKKSSPVLRDPSAASRSGIPSVRWLRGSLLAGTFSSADWTSPGVSSGE